METGILAYIHDVLSTFFFTTKEMFQNLFESMFFLTQFSVFTSSSYNARTRSLKVHHIQNRIDKKCGKVKHELWGQMYEL